MRRFPTRSRELLIGSALAALVVASRSIVPLHYEHVFDSDQAVVGLMAKHLSEFRAFPLFFYGQHYMLGVQSWIAVPFFWIGGPTVAMLRLPLLVINVAVAVWLMAAFYRWGVRPALGFAAVLPLVATTPVTSVELMTTLGASVEPFGYVALLWALRRRPVAFGALLCMGALHREFTIFALPAVAIAERRAWRSWSPARLAQGAGAFATVWLLVNVLKLRLNVFGPSGGVYSAASAALGPQTIISWLTFQPGAYVARLRQVITWGVPDMLGIRSHALGPYGLPTSLEAGSRLATMAFLGAAVGALGRIAWLARTSEARRRADGEGVRFCVYLALIALQTIFAYGLNGGIVPALPPVLRYVLFALLLPIALFGAYFQIDTSRRWQAAVALAAAVWGAGNLVDDARLVRALEADPPPAHHRVMADYLVAHGIEYGRAGYWDAYAITFLSRERAILASTEKMRISAYAAQVEAHASTAVTLRRQPCHEGTPVAAWCIIAPAAR